MQKGKIILLSIFAIIQAGSTFCQDRVSLKFGKLSIEDFQVSTSGFDSGSNAIIIADIGKTFFTGNNKGWFSLVFSRSVRVKILNKNGFNVGTRQIVLFHDDKGNTEDVSAISGVTYNIENGKVVETKMDAKAMMIEKYDRSRSLLKFSLPALKEGSIFELQYTIKSDFARDLRDWEFQGEYPVLWSEYEVSIPAQFEYYMVWQGDQHFDIKSSNLVSKYYTIKGNREGNGYSLPESEVLSVASMDRNVRWVKKNVPAIREEPFMSAVGNYNTKVIFQLRSFQWDKENEKQEFFVNWSNTSKTLLNYDDFGGFVNSDNTWMSDQLSTILDGAQSEESKVKAIYYYVLNNFSATSQTGLTTSSSLKQVYTKKQGTIAEINLLLTALIKKAGLHADPLILSTRDNGIVHIDYPLISEYNYVVCLAFINQMPVPLDASRPYVGFGQIPLDCYNGWGHSINLDSSLAVEFSPDSIWEKSVAKVLIFNNEKGESTGYFEKLNGQYESFQLRKVLKNSSLKQRSAEIQENLGSTVTIENYEIDSLKQMSFPVTEHFDFRPTNMNSADVLYFDPMIGEGYRTNPFKSMNRQFPVEIPYKIDDSYTLTMDIPEGYQVDELPQSVRVAYNKKDGLFEYLIQKGVNNLQLSVHLKFNKAFFSTEEYNTLRDFFSMVVKKENEQIVFKKKQ